MRRTALVLGVVLVLAGCSDADVPGSGPDAVPDSPAATEEAAAPGTDPTSAASPEPSAGACQSLPTDDDGDYTVGMAGSAVVRLEGDRLVLGEVTPAEGWQHTVDSEEPTEVEIEFTRDGERALDLEVEIEDDGLPRAEICADDDGHVPATGRTPAAHPGRAAGVLRGRAAGRDPRGGCCGI